MALRGGVTQTGNTHTHTHTHTCLTNIGHGTSGSRCILVFFYITFA